ncbi:MAG: enoyl-CoA hydratase/isomerase family protein [Burkholderiaceae bacterium]|nr:enoyl-CoA hydratase/isomerase family protein [Burkholderiaceae bacterium]
MTVRTTVADGIATIEIARPEKKNALTGAMYIAMAEALAAADVDSAVCAVLITGQPGVFTAGNDLQDFKDRPSEGSDLPVHRFIQALSNFGKPVVAAVDGVAVGIGATMLLHCDFVYITENARLQTPFVRLGLVPEFASSLLVQLRVGLVKASELLLLGETLGGHNAVELGIANAVVPAADLLAHARRVAGRFRTLPPGAVRETKALMRRGVKTMIDEAIATESAAFAHRLHSLEAAEAIDAFLAKRQPDFSKF